MQTLKRLFFITFVLVVAAAAWLRSSPVWTLVEISQGVQTKDVARVERVVAFERFSASSTEAMGSLVADQLGGGGSDSGGALLGALVGAVAKGVGDAVAKDAARGLRQAIADGRVERRVGALEVNDGIAAVGRVRETIEGAQIELKGTCDGSPATVVIELERHDDGPFFGHPRRFVVVGIEPTSARALARQCAAASSSSKPSSSSKASSKPSKPTPRP